MWRSLSISTDHKVVVTLFARIPGGSSSYKLTFLLWNIYSHHSRKTLGKPPVDIPLVTFQLYLYGEWDPILGGREARDHDNEKKSYLIMVVRCMTTQSCVSLGISNLVLSIILRWDGIPKISVHRKLMVSKAMAPHSSTLAWKIPWTEEPGRLQSMGSWRVGNDWATSLSLFTFMHWRRKWQPTPVFLSWESQGWGSLVDCHPWGRTESDTIEST